MLAILFILSIHVSLFFCIDAQDAQDVSENDSLATLASAIPHPIIAGVSIPCSRFSSWLSCLSCASMLITKTINPHADPPPNRISLRLPGVG